MLCAGRPRHFIFMFRVLTDQYPELRSFFVRLNLQYYKNSPDLNRVGPQENVPVIVEGSTIYLHTAVYLYVHRG